ncbi:MAG: hypothetical protein ACFB51_18845 [Anaerolineae bacterium]
MHPLTPHCYNQIEVDDVLALGDVREVPAVTIKMPTQRAGRETRQNPIRFKNLLTEAEERIEALDMGAPDAVLAPAYDLQSDYDFWQHQSDALFVFLSGGEMTTYRLPVETEPFVQVADRFHMRPLLDLLASDHRFYMLALSMGDVRLFQGTRFSVDEVSLDDVPDSLQTMLAQQDITGWRPVRFRSVGLTSARDNKGGQHAVSYVVEEELKQRIAEFFRKVDRALQDVLDGAPLVLAGVDYLHDIYRDVTKYKNVLPNGLTGSYEEAKPAELHAQAWPVVKDVLGHSEREARTAFEERAHTSTVSSDLEEVVVAAVYGRVNTLFVTEHAVVWGTVDQQNASVDTFDEQTPDTVDLLDTAAVYTTAQGGQVYVVEDVPDGAQTAAIFRY